MTEVLFILLVAGVAITLVLAGLALLKVNRLAAQEPLTRELLGQLLRAETDLVRRAGEDQARGLRQELSEHLKGFQDTTIKAFGILSEGVNAQIRSFGDCLDGGVKTIDQRVAGIAEKLNADLAQMGADAAKNREALRQLIEGKLDAAAAMRWRRCARPSTRSCNRPWLRCALLPDRVESALASARL
jgi:DNA recombination protein RmuC